MPAVMNTCLEGQYQGNLSVLYHHIFLRKRRAVGLPRATLVPYMMPVQGGRSHPLLHACKMLTISSWSATPLDSLVRCRTWTQYFPSRTPKFCTKTSGCFHCAHADGDRGCEASRKTKGMVTKPGLETVFPDSQANFWSSAFVFSHYRTVLQNCTSYAILLIY